MAEVIRVQRPFYFRGRLPFSKSWLARAMILRSLHPHVRILDWEAGPNDGEDVIYLDSALRHLANGGRDFHIGESGTGLRFLMARLSVQPGEYTIAGSERLLNRPHAELIRLLNFLGTQVEKLAPTKMRLVSSGWPLAQLPAEIAVDGSDSSQFRSALLLAASHVSEPQMRPKFIGTNEVSRGYIELTEDLVDQVVNRGRRVLVPEVDASAVATLAAIMKAASPKHETAYEPTFLARELESLRSQVEGTKQPDRIFFRLHHVDEADLSDAPDLFPILAALGACGLGPRKLKGAPHLRHKETDRISEIEKLFRILGIQYQSLPDGIIVTPISEEQRRVWETRRKTGFAFEFSPPNDHRLAFAATVLAAQGAPIQLQGRGMVAKSFPAFWAIVEGEAPKVAIIGHRGTGKTNLARRWAHWMGARATAIDLDREIERLAGKSTRELFENDGEAEFRFYERKAFREADEESRSRIGAFVLSCGAGFDVRLLDDTWKKIWVRRETDADGRIFFDRPRLDPELHPREESQKRFKIRSAGFREAADRQYWLSEGEDDPAEHLWARDLFDEDSISSIGGTITLLPEGNLVESLHRYLRWGVARIEIRDDLFPHSQYPLLWEYLLTLPAERLLISFRAPAERSFTFQHVRQQIGRDDAVSVMVDWAFDESLIQPQELPIELRNLVAHPKVLLVASRHQALTLETRLLWETLERELVSLLQHDRKRLVMKLALVINDFSELKAGHDWVMEAIDGRVFLPMSPESENHPRWTWYRLWRGSEVPHGLNFWKDGAGSASDQPSFSSWWRRERFASRSNNKNGRQPFAAVLGDPIHHSRTPLEHDRFFTTKGLPIFAISVRRSEADLALPFLQSLGLVAAAVTSPLKEVCGTYFHATGAINTIAQSPSGWLATSTDEAGFAALWKEAEVWIERFQLRREIVVWGGGGVLSALEPTLRQATQAQGRLQFMRASQPDVIDWSPDIVIWASGSSRGSWPANFQPRLIVDLAYSDDSEARAIALQLKSRYVSGLTMFRVQAEKQREFWNIHL